LLAAHVFNADHGHLVLLEDQMLQPPELHVLIHRRAGWCGS
jgi:hypothetical protein